MNIAEYHMQLHVPVYHCIVDRKQYDRKINLGYQEKIAEILDQYFPRAMAFQVSTDHPYRPETFDNVASAIFRMKGDTIEAMTYYRNWRFAYISIYRNRILLDLQFMNGSPRVLKTMVPIYPGERALMVE